MKKVVRVLIYEGSQEWLKQQMAHSLPDGVRHREFWNCGKGQIKVITLRSDISWSEPELLKALEDPRVVEHIGPEDGEE
jgi:hypothetical protein